MLVNDSVVALYVQLANRLSDAIYRGEYKSGDKLPSENSLCRQYGVSRITVRQALNLLVQQGLAFSVHGKGTFVKTPDISHELNRIVSFSRVLQLKGLTGHTRVKGFQTDVVDAQANKKIGGPLSMLELVGYAAQTPVVYYRSYFPPALGEKMWEAARQAEAAGIAFSTYDLYARIGIRLEGVDTSTGDIWYEAGRDWAMEAGISDGTDMDGTLTREQLATMLYRYAQSKGQGFTGAWAFQLDYPDADAVSDYAYEAMCWTTMHGIINGMGDGSLAPQGQATRAQVATMLMRFIENIA